MKTLGRMVVLVREYGEAIDFYRDKLGFEVFVDIDAGPRRFVHLRLPSQPEMGVWFIKAETEAQLARVGRQTEGQPCAVLYTDNLQEDYARLTGKGVAFVSEPRREAGAVFAHLHDLYGNEFVLVELGNERPEASAAG
ncbi:MAG: VOC family protein [Methylococcus sp.]|nr:VOC family protein [Methylococcus sp.]